ncbi:hypothetical protein FGO68_gene8169 [Halteria grandinella]|uniref:Uncharacterized protein n=1 Tax=Halteria grandinella TaxID=5974 RepID=A0A8J8P6K7_HALGN|nr:hypothetical protein FGO68_gene8169 [Halteria grandinella]
MPHRLHPGNRPQQDWQFPLMLMSPRSSQESTSTEDCWASAYNMIVVITRSARRAVAFVARDWKFGESELCDNNG